MIGTKGLASLIEALEVNGILSVLDIECNVVTNKSMKNVRKIMEIS